MARAANPADLMRLSTAWWTMMTDAQAVIGMRTLGMIGLWPVAKTEDSRMVSEKVTAMQQSMTAGGVAAVSGKRPDEVAMAMIKPLSRKASANAKRLSKRSTTRRKP